MALCNPPIKERPEILADWVELRILADSRGEFRLGRLSRYWDTLRADEDSDSEGKQAEEVNTDDDGVNGGDADKFLSAVTDELGERSVILGESYPFTFSADGNKIQLKEVLTAGALTYVFCLLLQYNRKGEILNGDWLPKVDNSTRDLFQACSTLAAAGHVGGCSISFGWPRPDGNPAFLIKLKDVYARFGEGVPVDAVKPGASPAVKDEGVDIIAWKPRHDKTAGTIYLLGQVATGGNWEGKSITEDIQFFHRAWFVTPPPSIPSPAMFIPHSVPPAGEGTRKDRIDLITAKFGTIFDRMYMPVMTEVGLNLALEKKPGIYIERADDLAKISAWVDAQLADLRKTGGIPLQ